MEEFLDILDAAGNKTGETRSYDEAHQLGLAHRSVHVWLVNSKNELLLQKRAPQKQAYPDHWDISVGGHISAGQTSLEAAKRETEEELGLTLPDEAFEYLFSTEEHIALNKGTYINNEFQDIYLVRSDTALSDLTFEDGEVSDARWVTLGELESWIQGKGEKLVPHDEEYVQLIRHLRAQV